MITVIILGFFREITSAFLETIYFFNAPELITEEGDIVKIKIFASIPTDHSLGMKTYHESFIVVTLSVALWNRLKMISCPYLLNMRLCKELEKQEFAEEKAAQKKAKAAQKRAEAVQKKTEAAQKRCQEKQAKQEALKKQRENKKKKRLQKDKKTRGIKKEYVLLERDKRLQCRILLERLRILRSKYETYNFLGKRPRTSLSMLIFNLNRALETGQPLQRFISSASKHLEDLNPKRRTILKMTL